MERGDQRNRECGRRGKTIATCVGITRLGESRAVSARATLSSVAAASPLGAVSGNEAWTVPEPIGFADPVAG